MHYTVMEWIHKTIGPPDVRGKRVVEAGSMNVNGSVRPWITGMSPSVYIGTDLRPGPDVDLVADVCTLAVLLGEGYADLVVSTEMMEHVRNWKASMEGMIRLLAPGGVLVITTRGPGFPLHDHPEDHWRYTREQMGQIVVAAGLVIEDLQTDPIPGVFCRARKPITWTWPETTDRYWQEISPTPMRKGIS